MFRKVLCLLLSLCLLGTAAFAEGGPEALTARELEALLTSVREQALASSPLNDPADEASLSEDGTLFRYEVAEFYAEGTELTAHTPVSVLIFQDSEGEILRGTGIDTQWMDLLAAYPLDNSTLEGTRENALLYLREQADGGFLYGTVLRDGQRLTAVRYGETRREGEGYRDTAITYSLMNGLVTSIRVEGLNPNTPALGADEEEEVLNDLRTLGESKDYRQVSTSRTGTDLAPFGPEDLSFGGLRYTELTPDSLPAGAEQELIDNEDGTWLLRCDGDGWEAVFSCDENGQNTRILSYTILDPEAEGPRCVRLGDLMSEDYCRFRSEGNDLDDAMTEILYGEEGSAQWGQASYDYTAGEASLRYVTEADGLRVELLLKYEQNLLTEIILYTV